MNQDTIVKFIKSQVDLYDEEIRRNAQSRLLAQHAHLVTSAGVPWLTEVTPEYNRSETKWVQERWRYRQEGDSIPLLPQVDEGLDARVKEVSEVLTRLGQAMEIDYDYVENLLEPLTGQSEYRYWLARSVVQTPMLVEDDLAPLVQVPAARPVLPLSAANSPLLAVAEAMADPEEPVATLIASTERVVPITTRIAPAARSEASTAPASLPLVAIDDLEEEPVAMLIASTERAVAITTPIPLPTALVVSDEE